MEQAGVETILCSLPEVEQGRRLGEVVQGPGRGSRGPIGEGRAESSLQSLGFQWSDDAQSNGGGHDSAEVLKQEEAGGGFERDTEPAQNRAEHRGEMPRDRCRWGIGEQRVGHGGPEGAALQTACAIGDVVRDPGFGELVQLVEPFWLAMRFDHERQCGPGGLMEAGLEERLEMSSIGDLAELPGGFESAGMRETSDRQCRVRELKDQRPIESRPPGAIGGNGRCRGRVLRRAASRGAERPCRAATLGVGR